MQVLHSTAANGSMALSVLFTLGIFMTYLGGVLADRFGYIKVMRIAFLVMVPAMLAFTNSKQLWLSLWLLLPVAFSLFIPYSSIVVLGQTYLGKSVGLASGITMGLGTTMGGMMSPLVGWGADQWGIGPALQILWVVALLGLAFAFLVPSVEEKL
jgi:FSR family fosmidomycin resistance protein-like MFS transporter